MGVKAGNTYKKRKKHRRNCPCARCGIERIAKVEVKQLEDVGISKFVVKEDWGKQP